MDLDLYFTLHTLEDFNPTLDRLLSIADIIVVEHAVTEFAEHAEEIYNSLSTGKITAEHAITQIPFESYGFSEFKRMDQTFGRAFCNMIANCRKQICVERSPLTGVEFQRYDSAWKAPDKQPWSEGFVADYLRAYELWARSDATRIIVRDKQHALQLVGLSREHPQSRILVLRGATHRLTLEKFLTEQGLGFTTYLCDASVRCMLQSELVQRLALGLQVDRRELLMSVVQGYDIETLSGDLRMDFVAMSYKVVNSMSESELELHLRAHFSARNRGGTSSSDNVH